MAFADEIHNFETGVVRRMKESLELARGQYAKRREFRRTYEELSRLSQRELDDLGIARANIGEIARAATYNR